MKQVLDKKEKMRRQEKIKNALKYIYCDHSKLTKFKKSKKAIKLTDFAVLRLLKRSVLDKWFLLILNLKELVCEIFSWRYNI